MSPRTMVLIGLIAVTALSRLVDHPPNFTPILAVALFGATEFRSRWTGFVIPLVAMLLSDVALELTTSLGFYGGWMAKGQGFHAGIPVVYFAVGVTWLVGLLLRDYQTVIRAAAGSLAGSILFFLITNFAWWPGYHEYPHTWVGLMQSYVAGIPYFGWTLAGTAFYSAILYGTWAWVRHQNPAVQPAGAC